MKFPVNLDFFKFLLPKKFVGVDIGTSSIKIVEISRWGGGRTLENYGEIESKSLFEEQFNTFDKNTHLLSEQFVAKVIKAVLKEAGIDTKSAVFSLSGFSTFFTSFDLPPMTKKEIPEAVKFTAPKHVPLPIQETTLDWYLIEGEPGNKKSHLKILVAAIPNEVVESYRNTAKEAGLELYALESEVFGMARSVIKKDKENACIVNIGAQSSSVSIVENGILKKSYSSEFSSNKMTHSIATSLNIEKEEAEKIKKKEGLKKEGNVKSSLVILIDPFLTEIKKVLSGFGREKEMSIEKIYLTGGGGKLPGLKEYMNENLGKKTIIPNVFSGILTPPVISETLKEMSPRFSVAVGAALQGLESQNK